MKLTVPGGYMAREMPCLTYERMPGRDIPKDNMLCSRFNTVSIRNIPFDARVLVDACGQFKIKILDPASTLLLLANSSELGEVEPVLDELRARKIIAVESVDRPNKAAIKEELRKSFYDSQGSLINSKFALPCLSPSIMAAAGFGFFGDATCDLVKCHHDDSHAISSWQLWDSPGIFHLYLYDCVCFNQPAYNLPFLSDESDNDITGEIYRIVDQTNSSIYCRRAVVLTRRDLPVSQATLKTLELDIDALRLNKVERNLKWIEKAGLINDEYFALREQFLHLSHFARLFRTFKWLREEYIALLNSYKPQLQMEQQVAVADNTIAILLACPVGEEMKVVISALVELEKARWEEDRQATGPGQNTEAGNSREPLAEKNAETVLAEAYNADYFCDASLNDLMTTGSLGYLFSDGYFTSEKRDDALMEILAKGAELTGVLVGIAENIHCLIEPFLSKKRSCSEEGTDLTKRHRSHTDSL